MKKIYLSFLLVMCSVCSMPAQSGTRGTVQVSQAFAAIRGDSLHVAFEVTQATQGKVIRSSDALRICPSYVEHDTKYSLPEVLLNGKRRSSFFHREQNLLTHADYIAHKPYQVLTYDASKAILIPYQVSMKLPATARGEGKVVIVLYIEDCCDLYQVSQTTLVPEKEPDTFLPGINQVSFVRPAEEKVKQRAEELTLFLNFMQGKYDILPHYGQNSQELGRVEELNRTLSNNDRYVVVKAQIEGYASPEGQSGYNELLSDERAKSLGNYIQNQFTAFTHTAFSAIGKGENWEALKSWVLKHNELPERSELLKIIESNLAPDIKEQKIKALGGGALYRRLLNDIFPKLRCAKVSVAYEVRAFTPEEVAQVYMARPKDLSHREIFDLAQNAHKGYDIEHRRGEFGRAYDVAFRYFPNDPISHINAGGAALVRGEMEKAWEYLQPVLHRAEAFNNVGIYYLMQGDIVRAEKFFRRAIEAGDVQAKANLQMLNQKFVQRENRLLP